MSAERRSDFPTCPVLGVELLVGDYAAAVDCVLGWARDAKSPKLVAAANTHLVTLAKRETGFAKALAAFDLILPDGMPLFWVMNRRLAHPLRDRIYGPTFMLRCLEATAALPGERPLRHMLVGGTPALLSALEQKLLARFPTLLIAGSYAPPFPPWPANEDDRILERIRESQADFVWVGLGCPKQELWLARNKDRLPPAVYGAVGAAFAFHAGQVRQAPRWMQQLGLEWLFRLAAEPRRLWRRYLVHNSLFLGYLLEEERTRRKRHPKASSAA